MSAQHLLPLLGSVLTVPGVPSAQPIVFVCNDSIMMHDLGPGRLVYAISPHVDCLGIPVTRDDSDNPRVTLRVRLNQDFDRT